jgi:two-component system cell cycle response regulator CtrA
LTHALCHCPTCGSPLPTDLLAIDREAGIIVSGGSFAYLTKQEFEIFITLYDARGRVLSKEALLAAIAPDIDEEPEIKIVDVFVCKIRKKLNGLGLSLETVWGRGYRMSQRRASE